MAVVLINQPENYSLAYNDNPYVFYSTNYGNGQRFKVSILQQGAPPLATERVYPRVGVTTGGLVYQNRAYYDPSRILQSTISPSLTVTTNNHATIADASSMSKKYSLEITEELLQPDGTYTFGDSWFSELKTVWNGVRDTLDWLDFDYTDYDLTSANKSVLSDAPTTQYIDSDQSAFLYFFASGQDVNQVLLRGKDDSGVTVSVGTINITQTSQFSRVAVGTRDLLISDASDWSVGDPATFFNGVTNYTVNLVSASGSSQTINYQINKRCSKYTPIRLQWLNRLGGLDAFNFSLKSIKETDIDRSSYRQEHHRFTGFNWIYDSSDRGLTDYHVNTMKKITVNTPFLTEAESIWMEDFATSPLIYQEVNGQFISMSGKPKKIAEKTSLNDKLMQYEFELEYSLHNVRQRG